jgi:hypothetical protein
MQRRYECTFNVRIAAGCGFGVDALLTSSSLRWGKELDLEEDIEGCENAEEYCET